jgi:transglycosylase-like protein with SLT domain/sporulation related protein
MPQLCRGNSRNLLLVFFLAMAGVLPSVAAASPPPPERQRLAAQSVCELISREARRRGLPESFLARLIWQESSFNPSAVSPVGAQGIAQFMPETARERGLMDPFAPQEALTASADFLSELHNLFGNLGLAAAAYNAGQGRVKRWLAGEGGLPLETRDYVHSITGRPATDWTDINAQFSIPPIGEAQHFIADCIELASHSGEIKLVWRGTEPQMRTKSADPGHLWGVQVAGSHSEAAALASFKRLKTRHPDLLADVDPLVLRKRNPGMGSKRMANVRIGAATRAEADRLCTRLLAKGIACVVLKN